jgi:hypothetical protein
MKTNIQSTRLLALIAALGLGCYQLRANDGIAEHAMEQQQADAKATAPEVSTTPPTSASEKTLKKEDAAKPQPRVSTTLRPATPQTGIRTPEGTLIHPVVQDAGLTQPPPVPRHVPTQEDYHMQQLQ